MLGSTLFTDATNTKKRFDRLTVLGFLIPILLAVAVGLLIRANSQPVPIPETQTTNASGGVTSQTPANPPSAAEVANANQTILNYCDNDLRADTSCEIIPNTDQTAPGFVETGLKMSGSFAAADTGGTTPVGSALAKGSGDSWSVIWVGQGCIPTDVASQNAVPSSFDVCAASD